MVVKISLSVLLRSLETASFEQDLRNVTLVYKPTNEKMCL